MRQHSGALERKWNRQLTRPIFPAGAKNAVWKRDYLGLEVLNTTKTTPENLTLKCLQTNSDFDIFCLPPNVEQTSGLLDYEV